MVCRFFMVSMKKTEKSTDFRPKNHCKNDNKANEHKGSRDFEEIKNSILYKLLPDMLSFQKKIIFLRVFFVKTV